MNILVDTHVLVWLVDDKKIHNLGKKARHMLESPSSRVFVSPLTVSEIQIKAMLGKMPEISLHKEKFDNAMVEVLDYTIQHAGKMEDFQSLARHDPFDRMLLAQALSEGMTFLTADRVLLDMRLDNVIDASS